MQKFAKTNAATRPAAERPVQIWIHILSFLPFLDHLRAFRISKLLKLAGESTQSWPLVVDCGAKQVSIQVLRTLCDLPKLRSLTILADMPAKQKDNLDAVLVCLCRLSRLEHLTINARLAVSRNAFSAWTSLTSLDLKGPCCRRSAVLTHELPLLPPKLQHLSVETDNDTLLTPFSSYDSLLSFQVTSYLKYFPCDFVPISNSMAQLRIIVPEAKSQLNLRTLSTAYLPNLERLLLECQDGQVENVLEGTQNMMKAQLRVLQAPSSGKTIEMPLLEHRWFYGKGLLYPRRFEQYREASPDLRALYACTVVQLDCGWSVLGYLDIVPIKCKDEAELRAHFERNIQGPLPWGDDKKLRVYYVNMAIVSGGLDEEDL